MIPYPQKKVMAVCLGIGLVLRDLEVLQFTLGEDQKTLANPPPAYIQKSVLTWAHTQTLLQKIAGVEADLLMMDERIAGPSGTRDSGSMGGVDDRSDEEEQPKQKKSRGNAQNKEGQKPEYVTSNLKILGIDI
jgi:hypothetical protein